MALLVKINPVASSYLEHSSALQTIIVSCAGLVGPSEGPRVALITR